MMKQILVVFLLLNWAKYLRVAEGADPAKFMIKNVKSMLVLDNTEYFTRVVPPQLGSNAQLWTSTKSVSDPNYIIIRNVAKRCMLSSVVLSAAVICFVVDGDENVTNMWKLNQDGRLVMLVNKSRERYLRYENGVLFLSLATASNGTDKWEFVQG